MQISFSNPSLYTKAKCNNLNTPKLSFGNKEASTYPYFSEPKIVEKSGYYYIELPSGQLSCIGKSIPKEKPIGAQLNEVLRNSQTPDKLRKFYDKIYDAAVKGYKEQTHNTDETVISNVVKGINDTTIFNDVKKMFKISNKANIDSTAGSMGFSLCSEISRLGAIVNVLKKLAK